MVLFASNHRWITNLGLNPITPLLQINGSKDERLNILHDVQAVLQKLQIPLDLDLRTENAI